MRSLFIFIFVFLFTKPVHSKNIFEITLLFMDNKIITLTAEIIEVTLEDQKNIND